MLRAYSIKRLIFIVGASLFWWKQSCTRISDVHYRFSGCFLTWYFSPHPVVPYSNTIAFVSSPCTFGVGEAYILFHSSPTFHMHMPLISTMVWNFTLKLKSLLSNSYLDKRYVLVLLLSGFEEMHTSQWETENCVIFLSVNTHTHKHTPVTLSLLSHAVPDFNTSTPCTYLSATWCQ